MAQRRLVQFHFFFLFFFGAGFGSSFFSSGLTVSAGFASFFSSGLVASAAGASDGFCAGTEAADGSDKLTHPSSYEAPRKVPIRLRQSLYRQFLVLSGHFKPAERIRAKIARKIKSDPVQPGSDWRLAG